MPHITVEYSANLAARVDIPALVASVHRAAIESPVFELAAVRTRAEPRDFYEIADGNPENAFLAIRIRMGGGRSPEVRAAFAEAVLESVWRHVATAYATSPLAVSIEVQEMDPIGALRRNNLHDRLGDAGGSGAPRKGDAA